MEEENLAFVTLATDDSYATGALVLAYSLKLLETKAKVVILITNGISSSIRDKLNKVFDLVEDVNQLDTKDEENLALLQRPELGVTLTKIHCWRLTQFSKCVFLDADTLVIQNCDELFERSELSAVPDVGWPDCFNSGVFVFKPSNDTFKALRRLACEQGSFDGGDQGLLNTYFSDWSTTDISRHLSFLYNMNINMCYTYLPAYKRFGNDVKIVHFLGNQKPWMFHYNQDTDSVDAHGGNTPLNDYLKMWWKIFTQHIAISDSGINIAARLEELHVSQQHVPASNPESGMNYMNEQDRLMAWEQGKIDYMGQDAFLNIQRKLDESIKEPEE